MALSETQREGWVVILRSAEDEALRQPLWNWPPILVPLVQHERRVRFGVPTDDDFDPEYH